MDITERFLNYTKFDTQSAEDSQSVPSTAKQLVFAEYLKKELIAEGLSDVEMDDKGYIYATLKSNVKRSVPTIVSTTLPPPPGVPKGTNGVLGEKCRYAFHP